MNVYRAKHLSFMASLVTLCYLLQISRALITDPSEVNALRAIRSNLIDPMNNLNTWSSGDPCTSNWTGISCNPKENDEYLHVKQLQLLKLNLSGSLVPEIGRLSHLDILDFMRNKINGSIPKEIGNITSLRLLLLSGNQLSGPLPEELGYLSNLNRLQIEENHISGQIPRSFANLNKTKHLHMNNNSISGQIPPELSRLPRLLHLLLDNNNLSGFLPPQFSRFPSLKILQLDNNNFSGSSIPVSYGNMSTLRKLSLRNCGLKGEMPDFSMIPQLGYIDLSWNQLNGSIPSNKLSTNITTIDLSNNFLNDSNPSSFSGLPNLQRLSLENNKLGGSVPLFTWQNLTLSGNNSLILNFQNNSLSSLSGALSPPENVTILLFGNPICMNASLPNIAQFCQSQIINAFSGNLTDSSTCPPCPTDLSYEFNPVSPKPCLCALPLGVEFRLKSPGISDFRPYMDYFVVHFTSLLGLFRLQLYIETYIWESGPRLNMQMKLFPNNTSMFNASEVLRIRNSLAGWKITLSDIFGPYELLDFRLGSYINVIPSDSNPGLSKGALVAILLGATVGAAALSALTVVLICRRRLRSKMGLKKLSLSKSSIKIDGLKDFTFEEMALATDNFSNSTQIGQGGYGKVYKGILDDGTVVAIKRAQADSLQGSKEFSTEIELLSRLHHRNLVSLVGYCNEEDEQMLVYEFMPNGTLRDHLPAKLKVALSFSTRMRIALETARGILYLHAEADPPIFHRDIKASNILLDSRFVAKVADFGLSRLAPVPDIEGTTPGHVSTVVKGTPGYLDPEYFLTHKLTDKSDVYSLGVVFLELLTGMHPISHGKNLVREARMSYQSGSIFSIIDISMGSYPSECIAKFISLALRCCRDDMDSRPTMAEIVRELESMWKMMLESDGALTESTLTNSDKDASSSSRATASAFVSSELSSTDFSKGASVITPR